MRVLAAAVAAVVAATVAWSSAGAVDVQIAGYRFGCKTSDGEVRKPKFGDVDGIFFTNLPAERKACLETIDRMIYSCGINTTFISHDLNNRYPECLAIFERQAERCARQFELQRRKCHAGDSSKPAATTAEPAEPDEPDVAPAYLTMWAEKRSNIRSGPGTDHAKVGLLEIGDEVQVTGEFGDWLRIEASGGGDAFVWAPLLTEEAPVQVTTAAEKQSKKPYRADDELATAAPAAGKGPLHGSISFSQESDGGYAWGIAWSFDSRADALAEAGDQCREYGGSYCAEVGWFQEACGALAIGDGNGYGAGWGDTTVEAERDALSQCRAANDNCRVEVARCSKSQEAGGKGRTQGKVVTIIGYDLNQHMASCADEFGYLENLNIPNLTFEIPREIGSCVNLLASAIASCCEVCGGEDPVHRRTQCARHFAEQGIKCGSPDWVARC